jgi:uncharacterized protein YdaU (DUF1376 family)
MGVTTVAEYFWTAFDWKRYSSKTEELSITEHGAYFLLLKHYYQNGGPITANAERLLNVCRAFADGEKAAVMYVLSKFFHLEGDTYRHFTCDEELAKAAGTSEKRRVAGKKGAEKTNAKRSANAAANAEQLPTQSHKHKQEPIGGDYKQILQIAKAYPKLSHLNDETEIPYNVATAIIQDVEKDGFDRVLAGTVAYAKSLDDPKFALKPYEFYSEFQYRQYAKVEVPRKWKVVGNG